MSKSSSKNVKSDEKKATKGAPAPLTWVAVSEPTTPVGPSKDTSEVLAAPLGAVGKLLTSRLAHRDMLRSRARVTKGKGVGEVFRLDNITTIGVVATSGGVYQAYYGGAIAATTPDWSALASLFDVCRCTEMSLHYQPVAIEAGVNTSGLPTLVHVPMYMSGDDDVVVVQPFTALCVRDLKDKRNHYVNTGKPAKLTFKMKPAVNQVSGGANHVNMAAWQDTNSLATATGGALLSVQTDSRNNLANFGTLIVTYVMDWSTRL